jgi:hypothetical protein
MDTSINRISALMGGYEPSPVSGFLLEVVPNAGRIGFGYLGEFGWNGRNFCGFAFSGLFLQEHSMWKGYKSIGNEWLNLHFPSSLCLYYIILACP